MTKELKAALDHIGNFPSAQGGPTFCHDEAEPTAELRFVTPPHTTTKQPRLQQRWHRAEFNIWGHLAGWKYEWRDVPTEIVDGDAVGQ